MLPRRRRCQTDAVRVPGAVIAVIVLAAVVVGAYAVIDAGGGLGGGVEAGVAPAEGADTPATAVVPAGVSDATIEYVHDGDTLFLSDGRKVRLLGIDTPEIGDNRECFGDEATAALRAMLPEGTHVRVLADVQPLDRYGRSLLFLYTDDDLLVNIDLIERGYAEAVVLEPNVLFAAELEAAEDAAQAANAGIWGAC
jgi:micrococcal nuclease